MGCWSRRSSRCACVGVGCRFCEFVSLGFLALHGGGHGVCVLGWGFKVLHGGRDGGCWCRHSRWCMVGVGCWSSSCCCCCYCCCYCLLPPLLHLNIPFPPLPLYPDSSPPPLHPSPLSASVPPCRPTPRARASCPCPRSWRCSAISARSRQRMCSYRTPTCG